MQHDCRPLLHSLTTAMLTPRARSSQHPALRVLLSKAGRRILCAAVVAFLMFSTFICVDTKPTLLRRRVASRSSDDSGLHDLHDSRGKQYPLAQPAVNAQAARIRKLRSDLEEQYGCVLSHSWPLCHC